MARGKKTGGRDFQKGQSGNPGGRPSIGTELKKIGAEEVRFLLTALLSAGETDIIKMESDTTQPMVRRIFARIIANAFINGDMERFDKLLNRLCGKPKEEIDLKVRTKPSVVRLTSGEAVAFLHRPVIDDEEG
jgi:hypothetical protein